MNLIAAMSLAGSIAMLAYYSAGLIFRKKFGTSERDILLKIVMFFFLFPVPRIKYHLPQEVRDFLPGFFHPDIGGVTRFGAFEHTAIHVSAGEYLILENWKLVYMAVGLCAALGFIAYQTARYFRLKRLLGICAKDVSQEIFESNPKLRELCRKKQVRILKIAEIQTPFTLGILRPVIFLPEQDFTQEELEFVLYHEAAHVRRWDVLVKWLGLLMVLLHWFNPLSYLLLREINKVSEYRCDATALCIVGDGKRDAYARLVVHTAAMGAQKAKLWASSLSGSKKDISKRVEVIMDGRRLKKGLGIAVIAIAAALSSFGSTYAYEQEETWSDFDKLETGEEWVFLSEADESGDIAGEEYFEMPDFSFVDFARSDMVFIEHATGDIIYLEKETEKPEKYSGCKHKYQSGTFQKHIKNSKGGCAISVYEGKRCVICGNNVLGKRINSMTYEKCPH